MHVEKNVCDSVIDTLLNIQGKIKDGFNTHQDLAEMGIRAQLYPRSDGKKIYLSLACLLCQEMRRQVSVSVRAV